MQIHYDSTLNMILDARSKAQVNGREIAYIDVTDDEWDDLVYELESPSKVSLLPASHYFQSPPVTHLALAPPSLSRVSPPFS